MKMNKDTFTRIFLKEAGYSVNPASIKEYTYKWWQNTRNKSSGGLRLTDEGLRFLQEDIKLSTYHIPYPVDLDVTTNVLIWLDNFIDCPYHLSPKGITVTNEKKSFELHLFAGDVRKYGINKALHRKY